MELLIDVKKHSKLPHFILPVCTCVSGCTYTTVQYNILSENFMGHNFAKFAAVVRFVKSNVALRMLPFPIIKSQTVLNQVIYEIYNV